MEELEEIETANSNILSRARAKPDEVVGSSTFISVNERIASRAKVRAKEGKPNTQQQVGIDSIVQATVEEDYSMSYDF